MILSLFFIFFLIFENLILPALTGPEPFLITPLFVLAMVVYSQDIKLRFIQGLIFLVVAELFSRAMLGSFGIPFAITIIIFVCLYSYLYLFLQSAYSFIFAWQELIIFIKTSILQTMLWGIAFAVLFKYGLIKSK